MSFFNPKKTFYFAEGTGRDTYISHNSGGYWRKNITGKIDAMNYESNIRPPPVGVVQITPKPIHYSPDGTGRDCYIIINHGGLTSTFKESKNFIRTLRNYGQSSPSKSLSNYPFDLGGKISPGEEFKRKEKMKSQKNLIFRLTDKTFYKKKNDGLTFPALASK